MNSEKELFLDWMSRYCKVKKITEGFLFWKKVIGYEFTARKGFTIDYKGTLSKSMTVGTDFKISDFVIRDE